MSHFIYCNAECHYAECHYAECHYAECHYAECHYVECHYAECRYAECRGAKISAASVQAVEHSSQTEGAELSVTKILISVCYQFGSRLKLQQSSSLSSTNRLGLRF